MAPPGLSHTVEECQGTNGGCTNPSLTVLQAQRNTIGDPDAHKC